MVKLFLNPFASSGDKTTIPEAVQVDGSVSYPEGWGADYSKDPTSDPLAKNIPRNETNQLYFDITDALRAYQTEGIPPFITSAENGGVPYPYGAGTMVRYDDGGGFLCYISLVDANVDLPSVASSWAVVSSPGMASTTASGIVALATDVVAAAMTNPDVALTPLNLAALFASLKAVSGYQKLPGGTIFQWLQVKSNVSGAKAFNWPVAFPTTVFGAVATHFWGASSATTAIAPAIANVSLTGATINETDVSSGHDFSILAFGN